MSHPLTPESLSSELSLWKLLKILFIYRLILSSLYAFAFFVPETSQFLGRNNTKLFEWVSLTYLSLVFLHGYLVKIQWPSICLQSIIFALIDIIVIILLMHASGGLGTGLAILLIFTIVGNSLLLSLRWSLLLAAIASIALLFEQIYLHLNNVPPAYLPAGIHGAILFSMVFFSQFLIQRARKSEALAHQRGLDIANLEQLNDYIIQHMRSGVLVIDHQFNIRHLNEAAKRLLPQTDHYLKNSSPELMQLLQDWKQLPQQAIEPILFKQNQQEVLPSIYPLGNHENGGYLVFLRDMIEFKQKAQAMKLASLGRLTASIAHEIRNPLSAISHASQLLQEAEHFTTDDKKLTDIIERHTARVNKIIENILQLSRRNASQPKIFPLLPWLTHCIQMFSQGQTLDEKDITITIQPETLNIYFDPSHLQQIIYTLCENAIKHGKLPLKFTSHQYNDHYYLDIQDQGAIIDEEVVKHMFEPFFTTNNRGTGLGLYIAKELCELNQANLEYINETPHCFRIYFVQPL